MQFEIQCWWIVGSGETVSQYPPNFSYVEFDKAVGLDFLDLMDGNLDWGSQEILEDLDSETKGLGLKNLGFEN